ncbi:MAG: two-component system, NtrC family, sensor kinase [Acidobacteriota bacterium]|jgi:PAS domain S-box-containing protein|nr:two-component system, NtrC family, sensor kinase [Acidobacteriota bacterium]
MMRSRTLKLSLSLLLAAAAVVLGGLSFYRKVQSFQPLGFTARMPGGAAWVETVEDRGTGLLRGDRVLSADGNELGAEPDFARHLKGKAESVLLVLRGDHVVDVHYHRPPLAVDFPYLFLSLIGVGYLLIGLYTLLKHGERPGFLFYLWCLASAVFYLLSAVPPLDALYRLVFTGDELARIFLPALTLHLFLVFPAPLPESGRWGRWRGLVPFLYLPAAVLLVLQLDLVLGTRWIFAHPTQAAIGALDRGELYHLMAYALASVVLLAWRIGRGRNWEQQRQLQWVALGLAGGYLPFFLLYVVPRGLGFVTPQLLTTAAVLPLALVPLAFAYAILRYKLWDIEIIVRDTISATVTLLLGIIGFSLVNLAILRGVPQELSLARNFLSFAAGLAIAGLLVPTRHTIAGALERFHYRRSFGKRRALSDLGKELLHERDLGRLCSALLRQIEEGVEIERANLYLMQGGTLAPVRPEPGLPDRLSPDALGEGLWRGSFLHLSGVSLPMEPPAPAQRLFVGGYRYAFPLNVLGTRVGIVLTGYKKDGDPLNSEDAELIRHLLNQAALAIENAQLLGQLHHQLEEVLRLQRYNEGIFESSPAGIAVLDPAGRVVSVNAALVQLAGRERAALVGRPLAEVLPVSPLPRPGEAPVEVSFCDAQGRERYLQLSLADFSGTPGIGENLVVLVIHDVSERVEMEQALKEKDRLAALGMLAAGVAHEVNTPITGISSYAQMLLSETAESDPHYDILKKVERQTFRAARIVNNLLEFAKNRQNERRPVTLAPLLTESLDLLGDRLGKRRIELDWQLPTEVISVLGCDGELQQVFTNLLLNALQAMNEKGGKLTVRLEADAACARVHIVDTGPGIPPERLTRVFEPFYSTKLASGGTGLGLAISYDIVRRHGGNLSVASEPGAGARFTVELPRLVPATLAASPTSA